MCMYIYLWASQVALVVKNPPANPGDMDLNSQEDPLEEGMATYFSIFLPGESLDREAWWIIVQGVTKSWT